jgi:hypothetical protein
MEFKKFIDEKYKTETYMQGNNSLLVDGLITVIYGEEKKTVEKTVDSLLAVATTNWANREILRKTPANYAETGDPVTDRILKAQVTFAKNVVRKPEIEVYERGEYSNLYYIVFNDFFSDACTV